MLAKNQNSGKIMIMKNILNFSWEITKIILIALIIVIPIRYFLFQPFMVNGQSMEPNFVHGDYLIVEEISYMFRDPIRGEVIVFQHPENPSLRHIKRIVGLPGETLRMNETDLEIVFNDHSMILDETSYLVEPFFFNETEISLGEDEFFVMGDNREASFDSRRWGPLPKDYIMGKVFIRVFSLGRVEMFEAPVYQ